MKACLKRVSHELSEHNIAHRISTLVDWCEQANRCSDEDERIFQELVAQLCKVAKRAKTKRKQVGPKPWSTGQVLQLAQKELP